MTDRIGHPGAVSVLGGGWRELAMVVLGCVGVTLALTYPLGFHLSTLGRTDSNDGKFSVWNVAWVARTLVVDPLHVFDANIFYPHRWTLLYSETNLGAGVLAIPAYWLSRNPYVANNVVTLLSFVLSALGSYYLVRHLTEDRRAAAISAICFAFCPYVFSHLPHIQLLMTAGLPFSMLAFHRLVDRPTAGRAVALGGVMGAQVLSCGYYGLYVMLMVGFAVLLVATTRRLWLNLQYWRAIACAALVAILVAAPLLWLYASLQRATGFSRTLGDGRVYAADWRSYLASSAYAHAWMLTWLHHWNEVAFPGFVATVLGAVGAVSAWSNRRTREMVLLYGGLVVLAGWASFGTDGGLYTVLYRTIPGFTLVRAPSRFCIVVVLALSTLAGVGIAGFLRRAPRPNLMGAILGILTVAELTVAIPFRFVPPVEAAYRVLARQPRGPVLEMPVHSRRFSYLRTSYMLASTAHWMPLVNGYSDYIPDDFNSGLDTLGTFPNRQAFALLEPDHVRYAVFHVDQYQRGAADQLGAQLREFAPYLRRLWADDHIWLYEIVAFPS